MNKNSYWWNIDEKLSQMGIFPDNTREAILEVHTIDPKIIRTETGATRKNLILL